MRKTNLKKCLICILRNQLQRINHKFNKHWLFKFLYEESQEKSLVAHL